MLGTLLAVDEDGTPTYLTVGLSVPRQNGKNAILEAYEFYKLVVCGESILHTAHLVKTVKKSFERLARMFKDPRNVEVAALVETIRYTNGEQGIYLTTGACIEFASRSRGGGRGATYSVVVFDEAQELTDEQVEAIMPTLAASPTGYRQLVYTGTPPGPTCPGTVFGNVRSSALREGGAAKLAWLEWGVERMPSAGSTFADLMEDVYASNPAMGVRLDIDFAESEFNTMSLDGFARERLGWWSEAAGAARAIGAKLWEGSAIDAIGKAYPHRTAFAVKFSKDGSMYALAGCKSRKDGSAAVELIEVGGTAGGTRELARALNERRTTASAVAVDGLSGASALCVNLAELKAPRGYVVRMSTSDVISASQGFVDALADGTLKHTRQKALDDSATGSAKRPIGSRGGWGFGEDGTHDPTAVEACAAAFWCLRNTKRDPKRKQRLL